MMAEEESFIVKAIHVWRSQKLIDYVLGDLDRRVKKDRPVKLSVFFTGLSSHLMEPINLFLKGESGSGKTYNTTETLRYFPQENIWYLGGMSQKALVHSHGILLNKNGEEIDLENRPVKPGRKNFESDSDYEEALSRYKEDLKATREELRESYTLVDLSHKILVFLEAPEFNTFQMLRPILSHDKEEIEYRFVDKTSKGQLRTMRVVLKGWPATIFLTTDTKYVEELATRSFTTSPENTEDKILEANKLTNLKASCPWKYGVETLEFQIIQKLIRSLQDNLSENDIDVIVPFMNLYELFPRSISRDMRDFQHFTHFLKTITLLHFLQRPYARLDKTQYVLSTVEDVEQALDLYKEIFETTRTGTEKRVLDFYHNIVKIKESWYLKELTAEYNKTAKRKLSEDSIRVMLERLDKIGYVNSQKDDEDKRRNLYIPLMKGEEKSENCLKTDSRADLRANLEKGFESWKGNIRGNTSFYLMKNREDKPGAWGETEIGLEELLRYVIGTENISSSNANASISRLISNEESEPKLEMGPEAKREPDSKLISANSTVEQENKPGEHAAAASGLIPCPQCRALGKLMTFASDHDLRSHVAAHHKEDYVR